ncbi:hypothetical protein HOY82DRAFT_574464 [Tuber indicum]|nr:hypothetical protein HOY82DRAFT_574464 [Tuber indicum]
MAQCHDTGTVWITIWWRAIAIGFLIGTMCGGAISQVLCARAMTDNPLASKGGGLGRNRKKIADDTHLPHHRPLMPTPASMPTPMLMVWSPPLSLCIS